MSEMRLYGKEQYREDVLSYYDIPPWGWFCKVGGRTCRILTGAPDIRRYQTGLQKAVQREMAELQMFLCQDGIAYLVIGGADRVALQNIIRSANAGYGKYRRFAGESVDFARYEPVPIRTYAQCREIATKIFNILYVADHAVSDV